MGEPLYVEKHPQHPRLSYHCNTSAAVSEIITILSIGCIRPAIRQIEILAPVADTACSGPTEQSKSIYL